MSDRFQVITCEGWSTPNPRTGWQKGAAEPGLSATVVDTLYLYRDVKTYRSEDHRTLPEDRRKRLGRAGALAAAKDHARYLNRLYDAA